MNQIREHILSIDRDLVVQIIRDYEKFEQEGAISECVLRATAIRLFAPYCRSVAQPGSIVTIMESVAFEAYRRIAMETLNDF
jgi:hypothetical protein